MTRPIANINLTTDTFDGAFNKINETAGAISTYVVTIASNTAGDISTGNGVVQGSFGANTLFATTELRGGTVAAAANLVLSSNINSNGALATFNSNVSIVGRSAIFSANVTTFAGNSVLINAPTTHGNTTIFNSAVTVNALSTFTSNATFSANAQFNGSANIVGNLNVTGNLTYTAIAFGDVMPSGDNYQLGNTSLRWRLTASNGVFTGNVTVGGQLKLPVGNTTNAPMNLPAGVAPTTPANGDLWATTTGIFSRIQGTTVKLASTDSPSFTNPDIGDATFTSLNGGPAAYVRVGNTTVNTSINATSFTGTSNNSTNFGGLSLATLQGQFTANAATAYSNAISTASGDATTKAATAYSNAISTAATDATTKAGTAYSNAVTYSSNATNLANGTVPAARLPTGNSTVVGALQIVDSVASALATVAASANSVKTAYDYAATQAGLAYSNGSLLAANATFLTNGTVDPARLPQGNATAIGGVQVLDSVTNTSILIAASANSVKRAYDQAVSASATAYSNATTFSSNATNLTTGTIPVIRLGSGTANSTTVLTGAQVFSTIPTILGYTPVNPIAANFTGNTQFSNGSIQQNGVYINSTSNTFNLSLGNYFLKTITSNAAFAVSNVPANTLVIGFTVELKNGGVATVTHIANTVWSGGAAPGLSANATDLIHYTTTDGGRNWKAYSALNFILV